MNAAERKMSGDVISTPTQPSRNVSGRSPKRLSGRQLVMLFSVALIAGVVLRLIFFPPTVALTAVEAKLVGNWRVTKNVEDTLWQFEDTRKLVVSTARGDGTYRDIWKGRWSVDGSVLTITNRKGEKVTGKEDFEIQFADTPSKMTVITTDGGRLNAARVAK